MSIFYRYEVARPRRFRPLLNRYPGCVIGAAVVVGRWAYCVKWGSAFHDKSRPEGRLSHDG